eukprot:gnl/TRDRNA2_/TRDRNA2_91204_c0_seq1.p1 gnl/TRDRNA2_/TRDRNA2_91204_c0~~gnl/TRDRNA2_/TRDRNA2_91204_c0_seq1.p1  ORF type:complete len:458 (+),score=36.34 gnl/TRDRNA2_/TRDRNA2_91204_c0_seq1:171-1544(+)
MGQSLGLTSTPEEDTSDAGNMLPDLDQTDDVPVGGQFLPATGLASPASSTGFSLGPAHGSPVVAYSNSPGSSSSGERCKQAWRGTGTTLRAVRVQDWLEPISVSALVKGTRDLNVEFRIIRYLTEGKPARRVRRSTGGESRDLSARIVPYEEHRLQLPGDAYINASLMPPSADGRVFIAAQGPLQSTVADFWWAVAHHKIRWIVALCVLPSAGAMDSDGECARYLPRDGETLTLQDGAIRVQWRADEPAREAECIPPEPKQGVEFSKRCPPALLAEEDCLKRRSLEVFYKGNCLHVTHLYHEAWPDHEVPPPESVLSLLEFLERPNTDMEQSHLSSGAGATLGDGSDRCDTASPILVHCRAGVGRTGCLIALCHVLASIRHQLQPEPQQAPEISVMQTVLELRRHRPFMVQTVQQYWFIYRIIDLWVQRNSGWSIVDDEQKRQVFADEAESSPEGLS